MTGVLCTVCGAQVYLTYGIITSTELGLTFLTLKPNDFYVLYFDSRLK